MERRGEDLFKELTSKGVLEQNKSLPSDVTYTAPQGKVRYDRILTKELEEYVVRRATPQTDLLAVAERQFVLPYVMQCAPIFRVPPITDDIYRYTTEDMKDSGLFCILSRSYVKRLQSGFLLWDPFVVVIKRKIVARVRCVYHPNDRVFQVKEVHLWQNNNNAYYRINDERLSMEALPGVMERYVEYERLFDSTTTEDKKEEQ